MRSAINSFCFVIFIFLSGCISQSETKDRDAVADLINRIDKSELDWVSFTDKASNKHIQFAKHEGKIFSYFNVFLAKRINSGTNGSAFHEVECIEKLPALDSREYRYDHHLSKDETKKLVGYFTENGDEIFRSYCKVNDHEEIFLGYTGSLNVVYKDKSQISSEFINSFFQKVYGVTVKQPLMIEFEELSKMQ